MHRISSSVILTIVALFLFDWKKELNISSSGSTYILKFEPVGLFKILVILQHAHEKLTFLSVKQKYDMTKKQQLVLQEFNMY